MIEQSILLKMTTPGLAGAATSQLRQEYLACQDLFDQQPASIQQDLVAQAAQMTKGLFSKTGQIQYHLPETVVSHAPNGETQNLTTPRYMRHLRVGNLINRVLHSDPRAALNEQLLQLERSEEPAVSTGAALLRHVLAHYIVHEYLPGGQTVQYLSDAGEEIPYIPVRTAIETQPDNSNHPGKGPDNPGTRLELRQEAAVGVSYDPRGFFLPQWVAVDEQQHLLAPDLCTAMADLEAMRGYLSVLETAVEFAPYMVVDEAYQNKHYGILGQLVNQGRALACYQVALLCATIKRRAAQHKLDRGLSISLPYFNDETLTMETYDFDVIPGGWVMFTPAFVVIAVRQQGAKVAQNMRLNQSTRKNLLKELSTIERAFLR